jgi:hypothetical protein
MAIQLNNNLEISAPFPIDSRYGPFTTPETANQQISSIFRYIGLTVLVGAAPNLKEYWYKDGTGDDNLIEKRADWEDITNKPSSFTPAAHEHVAANITDLAGLLALKLDASARDAANGVAALDGNRKISSDYLPASTIATFRGSVADQAAMIALSPANVGDWCFRTDTGTTWILTTAPSSNPSSWAQMAGSSNAHTHTRSQITDFAHNHTRADIIDFALHTHSTTQLSDWTSFSNSLNFSLSGKAAVNHGHNLAQLGAEKATVYNATPPNSPSTNDRWVNTATFKEYVYLNGGWQLITGDSIGEAPQDGKKYARYNATWSEVDLVGTASAFVVDTDGNLTPNTASDIVDANWIVSSTELTPA